MAKKAYKLPKILPDIAEKGKKSLKIAEIAGTL